MVAKVDDIESTAIGADIPMVHEHRGVARLQDAFRGQGGRRLIIPQGIVPELGEEKHAHRKENQDDRDGAGRWKVEQAHGQSDLSVMIAVITEGLDNPMLFPVQV